MREQEVVPVFEASLFKSFDSRSQLKQSTPNTKSRNSQPLGLLTDRPPRMQQSFLADHKEKHLLSLRIKLSATMFVSANLYKDDTAQSVADRVFRHANLPPSKANKPLRHSLATLIEQHVNAYIRAAKDDFDKQNKLVKKQ